jgi:hypothetical protein
LRRRSKTVPALSIRQPDAGTGLFQSIQSQAGQASNSRCSTRFLINAVAQRGQNRITSLKIKKSYHRNKAQMKNEWEKMMGERLLLEGRSLPRTWYTVFTTEKTEIAKLKEVFQALPISVCSVSLC